TATTRHARLPGNAAPSITPQPVNKTVTTGNSVTLMAAASGTPAPTVQWQVKVGGAAFTNSSGATSPTLTFTPAAADSGNLYHAVFTNAAGNATTSPDALLTVTPARNAPVVTTQPTNQTVTLGNPLTLTAASRGTPAPT